MHHNPTRNQPDLHRFCTPFLCLLRPPPRAAAARAPVRQPPAAPPPRPRVLTRRMKAPLLQNVGTNAIIKADYALPVNATEIRIGRASAWGRARGGARPGGAQESASHPARVPPRGPPSRALPRRPLPPPAPAH